MLNQRPLRYLPVGLGIVVGLISVILLWASFSLGYEPFMRKAMAVIHQEKQTDIALSFVSAKEFNLLQYLLGFWLACIGITCYFHSRIISLISDFIFFLISSFKRVWKEVISSKGKFVLILPFCCSIYYALQLPVTYDEAWTYMYFTINSPLSSIAFYPAPNNHMLFSLISNFTHYIPFLPCLFTFRLTSIVISFLTGVIVFTYTKRNFNENFALLLTGLASTLFLSIYYSYMARGYALVVFFFVLLLISMRQIMQQRQEKSYWGLYGVCAVLGLYTMPSFVYALLPISALLFIFQRNNLKWFLRIHLLITIAAFFLYLPLLIVNGYAAIFSNRWIEVLSFGEWLKGIGPFFISSIQEITGLGFYILLVALSISFFYIVIKNKWKWLTVFSALILIPFILLAIQGVIPYSRTLIFLGFILTVIIIIPFAAPIGKTRIIHILLFTLLIQSCLIYNFHSKIFAYDRAYFSFHELSEKIVGPNKRYYFNADLFDTTFAFEMQTRGFEMQKATNFYPTHKIDMNADTIDGYDFIIIDKDVDHTLLKKPIFITHRINVYQ